MRFLYILLTFTAFNCFSQQELELRIQSLKTVESTDDAERKYELIYTVTNLTDRRLSFFFRPVGFGGSMSNRPYYKCYQNNEYLDSGRLLNTYSKNSYKIDATTLNLEGKSQKEQDSIVLKYLKEKVRFEGDSIKTKISGTRIDFEGFLQGNHEDRLLKQIYTIEPGTTITHTEHLYWNKERYFTVDPHEYYVDEHGKHEFEITMVLMKQPFKDQLPIKKFEEIMADNNFIKGVFVSNKIPIDFGK